jgi:hypothetical protein
LLRALKPKFNRAGVWPVTPRFLVRRWSHGALEMAIATQPAPGWQAFGPFGSGAVFLRAALVRLLWFAQNPASESITMPLGWLHGRLAVIVRFVDARSAESCPGEVELILAKLFAGDTTGFAAWVSERTKSLVRAYDLEIRDADLETVLGFMQAKARRTVPFDTADRNPDDQRTDLDLMLPFPED